MLDMVETLKDMLGIYTSDYDFLFIVFSLIFILTLFVNLLGIVRMLMGGKR